MDAMITEAVDKIPPRFTCSQADWDGTPEILRRKIWRRMVELSDGINKLLPGTIEEDWRHRELCDNLWNHTRQWNSFFAKPGMRAIIRP